MSLSLECKEVLTATPPVLWTEVLEGEGEKAFSSYTDEELFTVNATSAIADLIPQLSFLNLGSVPDPLERVSRDMCARGEAEAPRGLNCGTAHGLNALGDLAMLVAMRRTPALVATVSSLAPGEMDWDEPKTYDAVLYALALEGLGVIACLEEVLGEGGVHHFSLSNPMRQVERLIEAAERARHRGREQRRLLRISPVGEKSSSGEKIKWMMLESSDTGVWRIRASICKGCWQFDQTFADGQWASVFRSELSNLLESE